MSNSLARVGSRKLLQFGYFCETRLQKYRYIPDYYAFVTELAQIYLIAIVVKIGTLLIMFGDTY